MTARKAATVHPLFQAPGRATDRRSTEIKYASLDEIEKIISALNPDFLECRDGHLWEKAGARQNRRLGTFTQARRCTRCTMVRTRELNSRGDVIGVRYEPPDGYYMPRGFGRVSGEGRSALRLASVRREIEEGRERAARTRKAAKADTPKGKAV